MFNLLNLWHEGTVKYKIRNWKVFKVNICYARKLELGT